MKKKAIRTTVLAALTAVLLMTTLSGCSRNNDTASYEPAVTPIPVSTDGPAGAPETGSPETVPSVTGQAGTAAGTGRQDGERFEDVIILEGMEETVRYEHIRNDALGFEMDYDYESFERQSEPDRECFISVYDDPAAPENYLEVTCSPEDAETVSASIGEALSEDYTITRESYMLDHAGSCIRIGASETKSGGTMPELLQMVYIIPASDGCRIAWEHYRIEGDEGFGRRFSYIVRTLVVTERQAGEPLTADQ